VNLIKSRLWGVMEEEYRDKINITIQVKRINCNSQIISIEVVVWELLVQAKKDSIVKLILRILPKFFHRLLAAFMVQVISNSLKKIKLENPRNFQITGLAM
jgi:hypothetical protein